MIRFINENKDKEFSIFMENYMRNKFMFLGIRAPKRKELEKILFKDANLNKIDKKFVLELYNKEYREYQYIAIDYLIKLKKKLLLEHVELIKYLIENKSWWDTVDIISSNLLGEICKKYPNIINEKIISWSKDKNLWIRRSSIIFQLRYKNYTSINVLVKVIENNLTDENFFIQKAIGWSLREYSKTNPKWVRTFVHSYEKKLSYLALKEAQKFIKRGEVS